MSYTRLAKKPLIFRSFTGLTISEFDFIYNELESKYDDDHERTRHFSKMNNNRQRNMGAGRPFKLKVKERLLMFLVYYRLYITYTLTFRISV